MVRPSERPAKYADFTDDYHFAQSAKSVDPGWCEGEDLNPWGLPHWILRARNNPHLKPSYYHSLFYHSSRGSSRNHSRPPCVNRDQTNSRLNRDSFLSAIHSILLAILPGFPEGDRKIPPGPLSQGGTRRIWVHRVQKRIFSCTSRSISSWGKPRSSPKT